METTLATILTTIIGTMFVIGLGVIIWAIAQLNRRVSKLEGLGIADNIKYDGELQNIYREFENVLKKHDENVKDLYNSFERENENNLRRIEDLHRNLDQRIDGVHQRIDRDSENLERILDKRFDSVYRKFYSQKLNIDLIGGLESNN
jgi:hypothetical protein